MTIFIQCSSGIPGHCKKRQKIKARSLKEGIKLSPFADDTIVYVKNPKTSTKSPWNNEFNTITGYKINTKNQSVICIVTIKL